MKKLKFNADNIIRFGNVNANEISEDAKNFLNDYGRVYTDNVLSEHLYDVSHAMEEAQVDGHLITSDLQRELDSMLTQINKHELAYIRIIHE